MLFRKVFADWGRSEAAAGSDVDLQDPAALFLVETGFQYLRVDHGLSQVEFFGDGRRLFRRIGNGVGRDCILFRCSSEPFGGPMPGSLCFGRFGAVYSGSYS